MADSKPIILLGKGTKKSPFIDPRTGKPYEPVRKIRRWF